MKFIKKENGKYKNMQTGNTISAATAKRYLRFYKKHRPNVPILVARGGQSRLKKIVRAAEGTDRKIVRQSPVGPVNVTLKNGKLVYKKATRAPPVVKRRPRITKPKEPQVITKTIQMEPMKPVEDELSPRDIGHTPENVLAKFGFAVERQLRRYAILDLKNNPNKFGDEPFIEYKELYRSQADLWKALMAAQRSDAAGLNVPTTKKGDTMTKHRTNVIAEFLDIPTWRAQRTYFSNDTKLEIKKQIDPISRQEVLRFNVLNVKNKNKKEERK